MILNVYLNESGVTGNDIAPTSNGYSIENDGLNQIVCESNMEMHRLKMASMVCEAKAVQMIKESGNVEEAMALNEGFVGSVLDKIKAIIKKIWAKIKEFFSNLKLYVSKFTMNDKKFLETYKAELNKASFDSDDLTIEGYEYSLDAVNADTAYTKMLGSIEQTAVKSGDIEKNKEVSKTLSSSDYTDKLRGIAIGASGTLSSEDFNEELFKALRKGEDDKSELKSISASAVISALEGQSKDKSVIEKDERAANKNHSDALKKVTELEKEMDKGISDEKDQDKKNSKASDRDVIKAKAQTMVTALSIANAMIGAKENALKEKLKQDRDIAQKILVASRKKSKKVSESTSLSEGSSALDEIMKMF